MSRIEEALERARQGGTEASAPPAGQGDVFKSAWAFAHAGSSVVADRGVTSDSSAEGRQPTARLVTTTLSDATGSPWKPWMVAPDPAVQEQFKRLAAMLFHGQREGRLRSVMVTSAVASEGKTLTALNLALVLAESYHRRVLLIDADLRRPRLSEAARLTDADGLGEALKAGGERKVPLTQLTEYLTLLPAGRPDPDPLSSLTSPRMQQLLEEGVERFDWVIVDTPPVTAAADAGLMAAMVDATVLVVKAGRTPHSAVTQAVETVGRDRIFGVVLNGVTQGEMDAYTYYPSSAHRE